MRLGTVLLKDEELARDLEYSKNQRLLTVAASIFTWLRQLSNWCRLILTHQLTPSAFSNRLNVDDVRKDFAAEHSSLLRQLHTVSYSVGCSVNKVF